MWRCRSTLRKRYVVIVGVLILVCVGVGVAQLSYHLAQTTQPQLVPPNPEIPPPPSYSVEHRFLRAAVCSDGAPCSVIGKDILARNGSVIDAAIATLFCNGIVNCQSMGLGGGFLMTLYLRQNQTAITLNARETAPRKAHARMFQTNPKHARQGALAVGVPGELKGYWEAHQRFGRLPWAEVVRPAIKVCEEGYNMTKHQSDSLSFNPAAIFEDPILRKRFVDPESGKVYPQGALIHPTRICSTLKLIAEKGGDELYSGDLAKMLTEDIQEKGGIITLKDLREYRVKWKEPISVKLASDEQLFSVPPPGSGVLLAFIMNILDGYNFTRKDVKTINDTITTYHRIIESFKYAFARRTELGDPDFIDMSSLIRNLTSKELAHEVRNSIHDNRTNKNPTSYGAVFYNQDDHGTAHISAIAPNGDAVSITSTVNLFFGAGFTSKQTGIILNSGMDDFSSPDFKNYFNVPASPANFIAPGKQSLSSMCPSIIVDKTGDVRLVIGASGGTKILTATAYAMIRHLRLGDGLKEAVDASRFHHQLFPMEVSYEFGILDQVVKGLEKLGHKTSRYRQRGSIICAIAKFHDIIYANADFRKGGDVYGF